MIEASDSIQLLKILSSSEYLVPIDRKERNNEHVENWAIARLLSTLHNKDFFQYPLKVLHQDRPDFVIESGDNKIGIEHTEAIPQNEAHKDVLRNEMEGTSDMYYLFHNKPTDKPRKAKSLIKEIESNPMGPGWGGNSVEVEWSEAMIYFTKKKITAMNKVGFGIFDKNWLLIYDNWPLPHIELNEALAMFQKAAIETGIFKVYGEIFIISGAELCEASEYTINIFEVNNVWN